MNFRWQFNSPLSFGILQHVWIINVPLLTIKVNKLANSNDNSPNTCRAYRIDDQQPPNTLALFREDAKRPFSYLRVPQKLPMVNLGQAEFAISRFNRPQLWFKGYTYGKAGYGKNLLHTWRCSKGHCLGRVRATPMGMVVEVTRQHNHDPYPVNVADAKKIPRPLSGLFSINLGQAAILQWWHKTPTLCFQGYTFRKETESQGLWLWICRAYYCKGRIAATPMGMVVMIRRSHNHDPNPIQLELAKLQSKTCVTVLSESINGSNVNPVRALLPKEVPGANNFQGYVVH